MCKEVGTREQTRFNRLDGRSARQLPEVPGKALGAVGSGGSRRPVPGAGGRSFVRRCSERPHVPVTGFQHSNTLCDFFLLPLSSAGDTQIFLKILWKSRGSKKQSPQTLARRSHRNLNDPLGFDSMTCVQEKRTATDSNFFMSRPVTHTIRFGTHTSVKKRAACKRKVYVTQKDFVQCVFPTHVPARGML